MADKGSPPGSTSADLGPKGDGRSNVRSLSPDETCYCKFATELPDIPLMGSDPSIRQREQWRPTSLLIEATPQLSRSPALACAVRTLTLPSSFAFARGFGRGQAPRRSCQSAVANSLQALADDFASTNPQSLVDLGTILLSSISKAHSALLGLNPDLWAIGTCSLTVGCVVNTRLSSEVAKVLVIAQVGRTQTFIAPAGLGSALRHVSFAPSANNPDPNYRIGRIGPYLDKGLPDLSDLSLFVTPIQAGDSILVVSDNVWNNFNPRYLQVRPQDVDGRIGPEVDWATVPNEQWPQLEKLRADFVCRGLQACLGSADPAQFPQLLENSMLGLTSYARELAIRGDRLREDDKKVLGVFGPWGSLLLQPTPD